MRFLLAYKKLPANEVLLPYLQTIHIEPTATYSSEIKSL
jgi:ABC-type metal ion transport system substrate-binding protein